MGEIATKIVLMKDYHVINTKDYGEIHVKHGNLDSLTIEKTGNGSFKAFCKLKPEFSIIINDIKPDENDIKASFRINLPNFSEDESQVIRIH